MFKCAETWPEIGRDENIIIPFQVTDPDFESVENKKTMTVTEIDREMARINSLEIDSRLERAEKGKRGSRKMG